MRNLGPDPARNGTEHTGIRTRRCGRAPKPTCAELSFAARANMFWSLFLDAGKILHAG